MNNYTITLILKETYAAAFQQIEHVKVKGKLALLDEDKITKGKEDVYRYLSKNRQFIPVYKESNKDIVFYNTDSILGIIVK